MDLNKAIKLVEDKIKDPKVGLPQEIFLFVSRITPLVNVDLLIKDEKGRSLLSWRDDIHGRGWHVPGGIVRFKERFETRLVKVMEKEIGAKVKFETDPLAVNQIIEDHNNRGHFISFLYRGFLSGKFVPQNKGLAKTDPGYLKWHRVSPKNLIKVHDIYKKYL
jgi:ADP-ribose pyrophosphatase YjhB (NUDIX family)